MAEESLKEKDGLFSSSSDIDIWKRLEQQSPPCSYWLEQSSDWYESERKASKKSLSFVFQRNNRPIGAIRYWQGHTPIGNYLMSLGGPVWISGEEKEVARQLVQSSHQLRNRYLFVQIHTTPFYPIDLSDYGLRYLRPRGYSFLMDLSKNEGEIWNKIEKRSKGAVRKAEKNELIVRPSKDLDDWRGFYELQLAHSRKKGFQNLAYDMETLKALFELSERSKCLLLICKKDDEILAAALWFLSKKLMVLHRNAWNDKLKLNANNLLFWKSFLWGKNNGFLCADLGGAPGPGPGVDTGIYDYKKSWGGIRIYHNIFYEGWLYGLSFKLSKQVPIVGQIIRRVGREIL